LQDRQMAILNIVSNTPKINVSNLAEQFGVSQVTIRRDLETLEKNGMLKRFHGGAMPVSDDDTARRLLTKFETKLAIAKEAAALVENGETVIIECGSTNALLAVELANKSGVTIITNSAFICHYIRGLSGARAILLGGDYQKESEVMVGPLTRICLKQFHAKKAFIGVDGFRPDNGFTCVNMMRAEVAQAMADQADQVIILTDSGKFDQIGVASQIKAGDVDIVITDSGIGREKRQMLEKYGIEVITVQAGS